MEPFRRFFIFCVIAGEYLFFKWREARPMRTSAHVLRVLRNTLWCMAKEKITVWRQPRPITRHESGPENK